ncbi:MAG: hypothetical protein EA382_03425 [Spirochaetaceae bacterium]|nr:MAG: hypothetical protein EA382_03425 [Spirochaetaceae bacterium]
MRILLVCERDEIKTTIRRHFMPRGAEIIQYYNPIKAMDNLDEVDPDVVLFSAQDFPRHWKPFLIFLRNSRAREQCVFVLLRGGDFNADEADKAQALEVNGIMWEQLEDRHELVRLKELVARYRDIGDARREKRLLPTGIDRVGFVFTHPERLDFVFGQIEDLSAAGVSFVAADRRSVMDLNVGDSIPVCSLRIGDHLLSFPAGVVRNERSLSLAFDELTTAHQSMIRAYVDAHAQRQLERSAHDEPTPVEPA